MLTDQQKSEIENKAKTYRNAVRRGDVTRTWAAEDCASTYTYPYAEVAHFEAVKAHAAKYVR